MYTVCSEAFATGRIGLDHFKVEPSFAVRL
jgi:hypothetical protein